MCGYLWLIVLISGFKIEEVLDFKEIFLVLTGCLLLTIPYIIEKKGKELLEIAGNNSMISAYLVVFVLVIGNIRKMEPGKEALQDILICLRPILYGFVFMVLMKSPEEKDRKFLSREQEKSIEEETLKKPEERLEEWQGTLKPEEEKREEREKMENTCQSGQCDYELTKREMEIIKLILAGLSNHEISEQLYIAESTVKKHISHIFEKVEVKNREQLKQKFR